MTYDVVIAGGGPVGLFLACELGLREISTLVLERMPDPRSPLKAGWMGMRGLNFPSVEAFYRRGMLADVRRSSLAWMDPAERRASKWKMRHPRRASQVTSPASCSMPTKSTSPVRSMPSQVPATTGGMVSLEGIEELLAERAEKLGVTIKRGIAVTDFTESGGHRYVHAGL